MNDTLDHTDTPATEPPVHHDPLGGYGYTPDPVTHSPWWRALQAEQFAEYVAQSDARRLADYVLMHPEFVEFATAEYRRSKAAYTYATAVRQVESERRWPGGIPAREPRA